VELNDNLLYQKHDNYPVFSQNYPDFSRKTGKKSPLQALISLSLPGLPPDGEDSGSFPQPPGKAAH
jgi:hypothetical protein